MLEVVNCFMFTCKAHRIRDNAHHGMYGVEFKTLPLYGAECPKNSRGNPPCLVSTSTNARQSMVPE